MTLPGNHPQRFVLNNEVHARPPEMLSAPARLSFLALMAGGEARDREHALMVELAERYGQTPPAPDAGHYSADFGPFRIKWERHTEFTRYKFIVAGECDDPFASPAIALVPPEWVASLPGRVIAAAHVALQHNYAKPQDPDDISERMFGGNALLGSGIAGGLAVALTDFRIHQDGFSRILVRDSGMSRRQAGRMIQRLLELDAYRMLALLALP
ncbi:MAG TPA: DUF3422 domain-containing protein, partial [Burkholderiales bacterium]